MAKSSVITVTDLFSNNIKHNIVASPEQVSHNSTFPTLPALDRVAISAVWSHAGCYKKGGK